MSPRTYLNADHDPADFATCACGGRTRAFDLPAGQITGCDGDWILAYVCDPCVDRSIVDEGGSDDPPIIQVPHLERLTELRMMNTRASSSLAH